MRGVSMPRVHIIVVSVSPQTESMMRRERLTIDRDDDATLTSVLTAVETLTSDLTAIET
jgi:hypothetical protein